MTIAELQDGAVYWLAKTTIVRALCHRCLDPTHDDCAPEIWLLIGVGRAWRRNANSLGATRGRTRAYRQD